MNTIKLSGCVRETPVYSHKTYREKFYKFYVDSIRKSGTSDTLKCIVSEALVNKIEAQTGIVIIGEIRTRNTRQNNKKGCDIFIFVKEVQEYLPKHDYDEDYVFLNGFVCKEPIYRETPKGRQIADVLIASNRERGYKSDYIPCIAWGRNALRSANMEVGTQINVVGRLQSREYLKKISDNETETRVAYEVSIMGMEVVENEK